MSLEKKILQVMRNHSDLHVFWNMFSLLEITWPDFLTEVVENYTKYPEDWFRLFHKQFRQVDVFDDYKIAVVHPYITEQERDERSKLLDELSTMRKDNKHLLGDLEDRYNAGEVKYSELREVYYSIPEYKEKESRLYYLNNKMRLYTLDRDGIGGHLDSIMWQLIYNDSGKLYDFMNDFMEKYISKKIAV